MKSKRKKPGIGGEGEFYRVNIRPKEEFVTFRYHDVGEKHGDLERLAGKRTGGSWDTQAWLINKHSAHIEGERLVADTDDVRELLDNLGSKPQHVKGNVFTAADRPNVPENDKPTKAQKRAREENIQKAQEARWT